MGFFTYVRLLSQRFLVTVVYTRLGCCLKTTLKSQALNLTKVYFSFRKEKEIGRGREVEGERKKERVGRREKERENTILLLVIGTFMKSPSLLKLK